MTVEELRSVYENKYRLSHYKRFYCEYCETNDPFSDEYVAWLEQQLTELKESIGEAENIARTEAETAEVMIKERNEALAEIETLELKWVKSYKALWDELRKWISLWRDGVTDNEGYMPTCGFNLKDILDKIIALETDNKSVYKRKAVQMEYDAVECCEWEDCTEETEYTMWKTSCCNLLWQTLESFNYKYCPYCRRPTAFINYNFTPQPMYKIKEKE